jgi:hypothetical protein
VAFANRLPRWLVAFWRKAYEDNLTGLASMVAYNLLLSIFPVALAAGEQRLSNAHASATLDRIEPHIDLGVVHQAAIRELHTRFPHRDPAELERIAPRVVIDLQHSPAHARLDSHRHRASGIEEVDRATHPPGVDLVRERRERARRFHGDLDSGRGRSLSHGSSFSPT